MRIPILSDFDKILGGLTWCIINSNFEIDIEFNDEMTLKEKIRVSEKIIKILAEMGCNIEI